MKKDEVPAFVEDCSVVRKALQEVAEQVKGDWGVQLVQDLIDQIEDTKRMVTRWTSYLALVAYIRFYGLPCLQTIVGSVS